MTTTTQSAIHNLGVAKFTVADQDAAIAFYTEKLGFELRADVAFGEGSRWVEVAPPGSAARLALNPAMGAYQPGGSGIGVETTDLRGEHARLKALGVAVEDIADTPGAPPLFMLADPDGNHVAVVEAPAS